MKYVVISVRLGSKTDSVTMQLPIIFPESLVHADVSKYITHLCQKEWKNSEISTTSAGFLNSTDLEPRCGGMSESLGNLKSDPERDSRLINLNDYGIGMRDDL